MVLRINYGELRPLWGFSNIMENFNGLIELDRLTVISKLESNIPYLEETKKLKIQEYYQRVEDYKALPFYIRWGTPNPEEKTGWESSALEYFVSYDSDMIQKLRKQIKAFKLSDSSKVWITSDSWLVKWLA